LSQVLSIEDFDRAIADFDEAIQLNPKDAVIFYGRGLAHAAKGDLDGAIADYGKAIELNPKDAAVFYSRGRVYAWGKENYARAIADYDRAIELSPKNADTFSARGFAYWAKGDLDRTIADYGKAIELNPKDAGAFYGRGRAFAAMEDYDRAIADYDRAIELTGGLSTIAFSDRGRAYAIKQDYDRAIADYNAAISLDPENAYAALALYLARRRSGAPTAAAELEIRSKNLKQPNWPYPVVELFLGRRTPEATLAAATKLGDRCEAQFYVSEWRLLRGDRSAAKAALKDTVTTCPKTLPEYELARAELERLRP